MPWGEIWLFKLIGFVAGCVVATVWHAYRDDQKHKQLCNAVMVLRNRVSANRSVFKRYAALHRAKGPEGAEKASINEALADECQKTLDATKF